MQRPARRVRRISLLIVALAILFVAKRGDVLADDTVFFTDQVAPNVVLGLDTSGSMREIMYHPAYDILGWPFQRADGGGVCDVIPDDMITRSPNDVTDHPDDLSRDTRISCGTFCRLESWNGLPYTAEFVSTYNAADPYSHVNDGYVERAFCGETRKLYHDGRMQDSGVQTWYSEEYIEWYFSLDPSDTVTLLGPDNQTAAEIIADIENGTNGTRLVDGSQYGTFQRSRMTSMKEIAKDVMYATNTDCPPYLGDCGIYKDRVRFGIARFRSSNGGYVISEPSDYPTNKSALEASIDGLTPSGSTPLGETLFQLYTYFMHRTDATQRPFGVDGVTRFPAYTYRTSDGNHTTINSEIPADPFVADCQKQFIIMITDGVPNGDNFTTSGSVTNGFSDFKSKYVGDYGPDLVTEIDWDQGAGAWSAGSPAKEEGSPPWKSSSGAGYLDDIALFMRDTDLRGDIAGDQTVEVYTVGFTTSGAVNVLLQKTARNGNGDFHAASQASELTDALSDAMRSIIEKAQSFTAATVPASRATDGNSFYVSYFEPSNTNPYWTGHLKAFDFTAQGEILDAPAPTGTGGCALDDPQAPTRCKVGGLKLALDGFWDAGEEIPAPALRNLYVSDYASAVPTGIPVAPPVFIDSGAGRMAAADLGIAGATAGDIATYDVGLPGHDITGITTDEQLADAITRYVMGCDFDAGPCTDRGAFSKLWDIFHSNPLVVGPPNAGVRATSYRDFVLKYKHRKRVIYAGSNGGFVHGFNAGEWDGSLTPPGFDRGTGVEEFGFMAYPARQVIANLPKDSAGRGSSSWNGYTMDGSASAADVWLYPTSASGWLKDPDDATLTEEQWRTALIGGMREGGRVVWALDVTDPEGLSGEPSMYPGYLWEFPCEASACDSWRPFMGETWSQPVITRVKVTVDCGDDSSGAGCATYDRWVAIFGAGYDESGDPNLTHDVDGTIVAGEYDPRGSGDSATSTQGRAIFMVDVTSGEVLGAKRFQYDGTAWDPSDGEPDMEFAFASAPSVFDVDFDGYSDVVVIGDLGGNVWKWNIHEAGQDHINGLLGSDQQPRWPFFQLMSAESCSGCSPPHYKSFFFPPTGALVGPNLWLAMGSGERIDLNFGRDGGLSAAERNRFYVFKDRDPLDLERNLAVFTTYTDVSPSTDFVDGTSIATFNPQSCLSSGNVGFYFEGEDGEKFITETTIFFGVVFTGSFIPSPSTVDKCNAKGKSFLYGFDLLCGEGRFPPASGDPNDPNERRIEVGEGMPNAPRVSVGPTDEGPGDPNDPNDPCKDMVIMVTSESGGFSDGRCERSNTGLGLQSWRSR